jgi:hypothetical protein
MKDERRGSEKLLEGCSGLKTLSADEMAQIGGGYAFPTISLSPTRVFRVFPYGIIDPEVLKIGQLEKFGQVGQISNGF